MSQSEVYLSVVIPVYNEEECLRLVYERLFNVLDKLNKSFEVIFTNDGSQDRTGEILQELYNQKPDNIRVIEFNGNFGQHMAIMAAFERARGKIIINLDGDLQNPPEEIPRFIAKYEEGYDYVGSIRQGRKDSYFLRSLPSKIINKLRGQITDIKITDQGCMMRAYSRRIVDLITQCEETSTFITALGYKFAINPTEILIKHDAREAGKSKYNAYLLLRVTFDLLTGFSMAPLHVFTAFGFIISIFSGFLVMYLLVRRIFIGAEAEGMFTLAAIIMFLISVVIAGIGIIGEYVGRIYETVRKRPKFLIKNIIEKPKNQS